MELLITSVVFVGASYRLCMLIGLCFWRWYASVLFVQFVNLQWHLECWLTSQYSLRHYFWFIVAGLNVAPWVHSMCSEHLEAFSSSLLESAGISCEAPPHLPGGSVLVFLHLIVSSDVLRYLLWNFTAVLLSFQSASSYISWNLPGTAISPCRRIYFGASGRLRAMKREGVNHWRLC
jgi:hypothetical protein